MNENYGDDAVKLRVYDIDWDTASEDIDLPDEVQIDVPDEIVGYGDYGDVNEYISDWLFDKYGFREHGFMFQEIES